jgi:hypothetical protein
MAMFGDLQNQASQSWAENQQRNEGLMREGLMAQQAETARAEAQNQEMMRQRQGTLQWMFGLLRRGGEGSLASFMSPLGSELGQTYQMGMINPQQYGQYYQGMMGTPDTSMMYGAQAANMLGNRIDMAPDYSMFADPESMRRQWWLGDPTIPTQTIPNSPNAPPPYYGYNTPQPYGQQNTQTYPWQQQPELWASVLEQYFNQ